MDVSAARGKRNEKTTALRNTHFRSAVLGLHLCGLDMAKNTVICREALRRMVLRYPERRV